MSATRYVVRRSLAAAACLSIILSVSSWALSSGDFSSGLSNWKAAWHVAEADGEAVLSDTQATHAFLFQADTPGTDNFTVEFDFQNRLSADVPDGAFNDSFYASIYYVNDLSGFITEHDQFDGSHRVMDTDANGDFNVEGSISDSPKGEGWSHFSGTFSSSHAYVVIMFELYDLNFITGDSTVRIDNVVITTGGAP